MEIKVEGKMESQPPQSAPPQMRGGYRGRGGPPGRGGFDGRGR